jgi:hypothetical protein
VNRILMLAAICIIGLADASYAQDRARVEFGGGAGYVFGGGAEDPGPSLPAFDAIVFVWPFERWGVGFRWVEGPGEDLHAPIRRSSHRSQSIPFSTARCISANRVFLLIARIKARTSSASGAGTWPPPVVGTIAASRAGRRALRRVTRRPPRPRVQHPDACCLLRAQPSLHKTCGRVHFAAYCWTASHPYGVVVAGETGCLAKSAVSEAVK